MTRIGRIRALVAPRRLTTMLYYLAVLVGLLVLYGRGDLSGSGFIYQGF